MPFGAPKCVIVPNFVQIGRGVVEIWLFSIFQDGGRPPSWIYYTPVWTTHVVYFGGLSHCAKFGLNRCSSFDNMQVLIFWALRLKMPIHVPFWVFSGQKWGKTETFCTFIPLGMQLTQKHAFWGITCQNRSSGLTPSCAKETTKNKIKSTDP